MTEREFKSFDGKRIYYRLWECDNPKGVVQVVHGMAESSLRYTDFAEFMNKNGYIVVADDHRGHGRTDDCSGYTKGDMFFDTLKDVAELATIYKNLYPRLPLILLGHSYGSFLTQAFLERYSDKIDGAIIGGSAKMQGFPVVGGSIVANTACLLGRAKKEGKLLADMSFGMYNKKFKEGTFISSIKEECEKYNQTWGCGFILSNNFYRGFFKGLKTLYKKKNYKKIDADKPLLLIAGSQDPVGDMAKSVKKLYNFYTETVGVKEVELVLYDGVRHEYFNDTSKERAFEKVLDFCDGFIAGEE
ncbi:MAG: alpha/beta hydrolase [Clostridia bacterium]|nr:alpha/beta hydrolase [Clostridia bacterium]